MGQEILYCCICQSQLRSANFEKGTAFHLDGKPYCKRCVPADRLKALLQETATSAPAEPTPAARSAGETGRLAILPSPSPAPAPEKSSAGMIAAVLAGLAGLGIVIAILASAGRS